MYVQMKISLLFMSVTCLACTVVQSLQRSPGELRDTQSVAMLELRRVNRPSSSQSTDHNVKIVLDQQKSLPTLHHWVLIIVRKNNTQSVYEVHAEDAYQKEMEFEADLTDGTYVYIAGKDSQDITLINSFTELNEFFLSSRVARVGTEYDESVSSLRVWPGDITENVTVGQHWCQRKGFPCYYLSTTLPRDVPRCVNNNNDVKQCDDFITDFQKFSESPKLNITSDGLLTVEASVDSNSVRMEAVVFDPQDPTKIFSPENYECQLEVKQGVVNCQQKLIKDTGNQQKFSVLLVSLNQEGYVLRSAMESFGDDPGRSSASTGVIVGSVVGGVFGAALLAGAAVFFIKKKKGSSNMNKPFRQKGISSERYDIVSVRDHSSKPMDA